MSSRRREFGATRLVKRLPGLRETGRGRPEMLARGGFVPLELSTVATDLFKRRIPRRKPHHNGR